jgi:predicted DNA-binding protein with PD1-like motif
MLSSIMPQPKSSRRRLVHPGPASPERIESRKGEATALAFVLEPGLTINEAITRPLLEAGMRGGLVEIEGGALGPFTYVVPAVSPDEDHVAFFSRPYVIDGLTRIERASISVGWRENAPFIHCHGLWIEPDGSRRGGHMMPFETVIAEPVQARAWGLKNATYLAEHDPETNFTLFRPVDEPTPRLSVGKSKEKPPGSLARIRPHEDICEAVETLCRQHGIGSAVVRGVGSLVGAEFEDGRTVSSHATEVLITQGSVQLGHDGVPVASLEVAMVDIYGEIHEGRLIRGRNSTCITFETYLEEVSTGGVSGEALASC